MRRRRLAASLLLAIVFVGVPALLLQARLGRDGGSAAAAPGLVRVSLGGREVARFQLAALSRGGRIDAAAARAALAEVLPRRVRRGAAWVTYRYDVPATARRIAGLGTAGGGVDVVARPLASAIAAPVVRQAQRNTCESAALEVLLASAGVRVSQGRLQASLPRSGPPDPSGVGPERVWGDPELGFVGRPDGGGAAGGFGVYQRPVAAVARRYGARLRDLSGAAPASVYERLLSGRAVMAWVGLSSGPYGEWRSPEGRRVRVNFGEHTVVLVGVRGDGMLRVVNPLQGTREVWSKARFESMWQLLDRRALST